MKLHAVSRDVSDIERAIIRAIVFPVAVIFGVEICGFLFEFGTQRLVRGRNAPVVKNRCPRRKRQILVLGEGDDLHVIFRERIGGNNDGRDKPIPRISFERGGRAGCCADVKQNLRIDDEFAETSPSEPFP